MQRFSAFHPLASFLYFAAVIMISMFSRNIIVAALSVTGAFLFALTLRSASGMWIYTAVFILTALTNPLFSHNGVTVLFFLNGNRVTLESIIYGVYLGLMIMSVLIWFSCYNLVITSDKFLCLFGGIMPKAALVVSMALRLVPAFINDGGEMLAIQSSLSSDKKGLIIGLKRHIAVFSCLITRTLEGAVERSDSMRARGYGAGRRTSYSRFRFNTSDAALLLLTVIWLAYMIFFGGVMDYNYYPEMDAIEFSASYILTALFFILPSAVNVWGELRWKYWVSKI